MNTRYRSAVHVALTLSLYKDNFNRISEKITSFQIQVIDHFELDQNIFKIHEHRLIITQNVANFLHMNAMAELEDTDVWLSLVASHYVTAWVSVHQGAESG